MSLQVKGLDSTTYVLHNYFYKGTLMGTSIKHLISLNRLEMVMIMCFCEL